MGVKFKREYEEIVIELISVIHNLTDYLDLLEINQLQWSELDNEQQEECLRTLADDVFYSLGTEPELQIGDDVIVYDPIKHTIQAEYRGDQKIRIIHLI